MLSLFQSPFGKLSRIKITNKLHYSSTSIQLQILENIIRIRERLDRPMSFTITFGQNGDNTPRISQYISKEGDEHTLPMGMTGDEFIQYMKRSNTLTDEQEAILDIPDETEDEWTQDHEAFFASVNTSLGIVEKPKKFDEIIDKFKLQKPLNEMKKDTFYFLKNNPLQFDAKSHISTHIYSIIQETESKLWISTYNASDLVGFYLLFLAIQRGVDVYFTVDKARCGTQSFQAFHDTVVPFANGTKGSITFQAITPQGGCNHDKITNGDGKYCVISSSNWSQQSRDKNWEAGVFFTNVNQIQDVTEFMKQNR